MLPSLFVVVSSAVWSCFIMWACVRYMDLASQSYDWADSYTECVCDIN